MRKTFYVIDHGLSSGVYDNEIDFKAQVEQYPTCNFNISRKEADAHEWLAIRSNGNMKRFIEPSFLFHSHADHVQKASIITIIHLPSNTIYDQVVYPRLNALLTLEYITIASLLRTIEEKDLSEVIYTTNAKIVNWMSYETPATYRYIYKEPYPKEFTQVLQDTDAWLATQASRYLVMFWDEIKWGPMPVCGVPPVDSRPH